MTRLLSYALSALIAVSALANTDLIVFTDSRNALLVDPGTTATLIVNMRNKGPDPAQNVTLHFPFPPASRLVSLETSDGWTCSANDAGAVCSRATFQPNGLNEAGQHVTATVVLSSDPNGYNWYDVATVTSDTPDSAPGNNSTQVSSIVYRRFHVDTTSDSGAGSLRAAIEDANARCSEGVPCKMTIDLPAHSTIEPLTPLPAIRAGYLLIDGDQNRDGDRLVELSGTHLSAGNGLEIRAVTDLRNPLYVQIYGLAINNFPDFGVMTTGSGSATVLLKGLFIGTDATGTIARPNGRGIGSYCPSTLLNVRDCLVSGNTHSGFFQWESGNLALTHVLVGVGSDGRPLGNGNSGVFAFRGTMDVAGSTIANNGQFGVAMEPGVQRASIEGSSIFANGIFGIDWGLDGSGSSKVPPPVITDAVYDPAANVTVVTGRIASSFALRIVEIFASNSRDSRGQAEGERVVGSMFMTSDDFTLRAKGDLRGQIMTATLNVGPYLDSVPTLTSEFSEGVVAH
jgi:uncharacterized repeat protein (TIGR01451 family)